MLCGSIFISGTHRHDEILIHMSQLRTFKFHFASENTVNDSTKRISESDIQKTFTSTTYQEVFCMVDNLASKKLICRSFTLLFKFHRLEYIGRNIPNVIFESVTYLKLWDSYPFKYEFFVRLAQAFPFLKSLSISKLHPPFLKFSKSNLAVKDWFALVQYPYLISLDIERACCHYVECFLNEAKAYLLRLTELTIFYEDLVMATNNFTTDETRRNCANVRRLTINHYTVYPKDVYSYFPLLSYLLFE